MLCKVIWYNVDVQRTKAPNVRVDHMHAFALTKVCLARFVYLTMRSYGFQRKGFSWKLITCTGVIFVYFNALQAIFHILLWLKAHLFMSYKQLGVTTNSTPHCRCFWANSEAVICVRVPRSGCDSELRIDYIHMCGDELVSNVLSFQDTTKICCVCGKQTEMGSRWGQSNGSTHV